MNFGLSIHNLVFSIILLLISTGFVTYILFSIRFYCGFKNYKPVYSYKKRTVSIVMACRNEAPNLGKLLTSLINQSYPKEMYEIIIADDDSTDGTSSIIESFANMGVKITHLKVQGRDQVVSPKKNALEKAINAATAEIILTTDADCIVPMTWIENMISMFTDDVTMVAGYSRTLIKDWDKASILHKYEHFDFAATYMVMSGGYTLGKSWACIGQNLAYRRAAFFEVGGFDSIRHLISGDDVNLMQLMRRKGMKIIFNFDPKSFVYTYPVKSWKQLVNQRSRWASNMKYQLKFNSEFFFILLSMSFMYWGSLIVLVFSWKIALAILILRVIIENIFFGNTRSRFGVTRKMAMFYPIWIVIQTFFLVFTMVLGQFNLFEWYGKKPYQKRGSNVPERV